MFIGIIKVENKIKTKQQEKLKNLEISAKTSSRCMVYIDGFNLYFGLKSKNWKKYYWLDMELLALNLAKSRQLIGVKYFTAKVKNLGDNTKSQRQRVYLKALKSHCKNLEIIQGHYLLKPRQCRNCGDVWIQAEEKKTDVNIATHLLMDAFHDEYDTAIIVSADSDLIPPIEMILNEWPNKKIIVAFPPDRRSGELSRKATDFFRIYEKVFRISQLPRKISTAAGNILERPQSWH